ncbi:hypothetical protein P3S37_27280, partial [Enterobacter hormaechei]|uniref:hypothetical protein n=2 Tax=Enterobacter TaxID=547 RepID=UPI00298ACB15|nr:hypothetical protein [Enterobacter hormaechei]
MEANAQRYRLKRLCGVNRYSCLVEMSGGYALFQPDLPPANGTRVLVHAFGQLQFAVVMSGA